MTTSVLQHEAPATSLRTLLGQVERYLAQFAAMLAAELRSEHSFVGELVRYGCRIGGRCG